MSQEKNELDDVVERLRKSYGMDEPSEPSEASAKEPEEEPIEEPIEEPSEASVKEPEEEPAEEPVEEPVEEPLPAEPIEEPAEEPIEEPMEEPVEELTEEPVEEPMEEPMEEPAEEPAEQSLPAESEEEQLQIDVPTEVPVENSEEFAAEPEEEPIEEPTEEPEEEEEIIYSPNPQRKPEMLEQLTLGNIPTMQEEAKNYRRDFFEEEDDTFPKELSTPYFDAPAPADEGILQKSGLSSEDVAVILEFGYERELSHVLGAENVRLEKYENPEKTGLRADLHPYADGKLRQEFLGKDGEKEKVEAHYKSCRKNLFWRVLVTSIFMALLLGFDTVLEFLSGGGSVVLMPSVYGMILLAGAVLLSHRGLYAGYRSIVLLIPNPYSVPAILIPIALVANLLSILQFGTQMPTVNFLTVYSILILVVCDFLRLDTEKTQFAVVSQNCHKAVLEPYIPTKQKLCRGNGIYGIINESAEENTYLVKRAERVTGFLRRSGSIAKSAGAFSLLLPLAIGVAVFGTLVCALLFDRVAMAIPTFVNIFLFCVPISAVFGFFYPSWRGSRELGKTGYAIVGEESIAELAEKKRVIFRGGKALCCKINKYVEIPGGNEGDLQENLHLCELLFRKIGVGGLEPAAEESTAPVFVLRIREGIKANVNRHFILAGSLDYLEKCGVKISIEKNGNGEWTSGDVAMLYVAIDGVLRLRFDLEYRASEAFEPVLSGLTDKDTWVGIYTCDPNLTDAFFAKLFQGKNPPFIVKPGQFEEVVVGITDSPVVSAGDGFSVAKPLQMAKQIQKARKSGFLAQGIATVVGGVFCTLLTLFGNAGLLGMGTVIAYHLSCLVVVWAVESNELKKYNP